MADIRTHLLQCKVAMHYMPICSYTRVTIHSYTREINQLLRLVYESTWPSASIRLQGINFNPCNKYESSTSKPMFARIIGVNLDVYVCVHMCSYVSNGVKDTVVRGMNDYLNICT